MQKVTDPCQVRSHPGRIAVGALVVALLVTGCAHRTGSTRADVPAPRARAVHTSPERLLTAEDLARLEPTQSLYEAIVSLRPYFLTYRGTSPTVYRDGVRVGPVTSLREIPVGWVDQVQVLSPDEAHLRHGATGTGAVILVTSRNARRP
jgi:hypothetical protein